MRIAIPITPSDVARKPDGSPVPGATVQQTLEATMQCFRFFGGLEQHYILLVPTPSQAGLAQDALEDFQRTICPNTRIAAVDSDPRARWPVAANNHFAQTCRLVARQPEEMPWLWYEMDSFPDQVGWLDRIATALQQSGKNRFLGHVIGTEFIDKEGIKSSHPGDLLMLGVAVYPHELGVLYDPDQVPAGGSPETNWRLGMYHMLSDLSIPGDPKAEGFRGVSEPFDWYLRHQIARGGRQHTDLIADQWNTYNYRLEEEMLMCDAGPARADAPHGRPRGGMVNPQAVLIHGCKDLTGHRLAASGQIPRTVYVPPAAEKRYFQVGTLGAHSDAEDPMFNLMKMMVDSQQKTNRMLEQVLAAKPSNGHTAAAEPTKTEQEIVKHLSAREKFVAAEAAEIAKLPTVFSEQRAEDPMVDKILVFMDGGAQTLKRIADHLGVTREEAEAAIKGSSKLVIRPGGAQWVNIVNLEEVTL